MSALSIQPTYPIFTDIDGQPLEDGYVWIGTANLDPQTNPINVYWDAALTLPAAQPIRTLAGYPANSGTPARLYVNSDYSIRVMNKNGSAVYSAPAATERYASELISFIQAGIGAVQTTAQEKMRQIISAKDFGVSPSASPADNVIGLKNALNHIVSIGGGILDFLPGNYTLDGAQLGNYTSSMGSSIDAQNASGITLQGYGATITMTNAVGKVWFRFRSCTNITVKGLSFQGAQVGNGATNSSGVPLYFDTAASNITIEDVSGRQGFALIEFQTDSLVPMGGVKYQNVTLKNISTVGFYHAMELLNINNLTTTGIKMQGTGAGNFQTLRGIYALGVTNWNGSDIYSTGYGTPGVGGYPIFIREYAPSGLATLPNYNCDTINLTNVALVNNFCGGLEIDIADGQIKNVNISNLTITADPTNNYGGGLLEIAHDTTNAPLGINNVKFSNVQISGSPLGVLACILYRHTSNVASNEIYCNQHFYENLQVDGFDSPCFVSGTAGGWISGLKMNQVRFDNTAPIGGGDGSAFAKIYDGFVDSFTANSVIGLGSNLVRMEFDNATAVDWIEDTNNMFPVVINGDASQVFSGYVNKTTGNDDNNGSSTAPIKTLAEATRRISRLNRGSNTFTFTLQTNENYGSMTLRSVAVPISMRMPLGATLDAVVLDKVNKFDLRNGTNCTGGIIATGQTQAYIESVTFSGTGTGLTVYGGSKVTSSNNVFSGTLNVGMLVREQSTVWSTVDTGTVIQYGYQLGEAAICYKEATSTLTGGSGQKQSISVNLANF